MFKFLIQCLSASIIDFHFNLNFVAIEYNENQHFSHFSNWKIKCENENRKKMLLTEDSHQV